MQSKKRSIVLSVVFAAVSGISPLAVLAERPNFPNKHRAEMLREHNNGDGMPNAAHGTTAPAPSTMLAKGDADDGSNDKNLLEWLSEAGFFLQRGSGRTEQGLGASFSFLAADESDVKYGADFFLGWKGGLLLEGPKDARLHAITSVEGHLSNDKADNEDALRFRGGLAHDIPKFGLVDGVYATYQIKHESDPDFDVSKLSGEFEFTPTIGSLAMGRIVKPNDYPVGFIWRPYMGLEGGATLAEGESPETEGALFRMNGKARAMVILYFLETWGFNKGGVKPSTVHIEPRFVYRPLDNAVNPFLVTGIEIAVTDNFTVGFEHKRGESPPEFRNITSYGLTIGIRF